MTENTLVAGARSHIQKLKESQMKIYGIMAHGLVPEELIYAAGGFPLRLSLLGDRNTVTKGIEYLTSATCSFARSTIGSFDLKNPVYNELDAIVAGNYCNGELCTTELISEYFNIPDINIVFPSSKTPSALKFMEAELHHFREELERFSGKKISDVAISEAIKLYNQERKLYQTIVQTQNEKGFLLSGVESTELLYKHFLYGVEASIENLQGVVNGFADKSPFEDGKRIMFVGNGVPIGDNMIRLIEDQGFLVINNLTWTGLDYYDSVVEEGPAPIEALAKYYINAENSGRMILSDNYLTDLIHIFKKTKADGILFYFVKYCSLFPSVVSYNFKQTLIENNIPYLEIERDYGVTTDAQLQTRLQAFKEMIA